MSISLVHMYERLHYPGQMANPGYHHLVHLLFRESHFSLLCHQENAILIPTFEPSVQFMWDVCIFHAQYSRFASNWVVQSILY